MTRDLTTAQAQLERILYILPAAARGSGIPIAQLAAELGVEPATVLRDLEAVTARAFYHPAGSTDAFTIMIDRGRVRVDTRHEFDRPVRLTPREALALGLGLRVLATDVDEGRRGDILGLAERLEGELVTPDVLDGVDDVEFEDGFMLGFDDDGFRGVVADAIELGRMCTLWYLKPGDLAPMHRTVAPYRLVHANGTWYVAALDTEREGMRFFRMDRVLDATLSEDAAPPPPGELQDMLRGGAPYIARDEVEVSVRYSPRVARWVMEHAPACVEEDGSVVVTHRVADPRWIVRHVLQYAGDAVIEAPEPARWWVVAAANGVAAL
jgi:predicted DNA-binding transcriptional regulator YafY